MKQTHCTQDRAKKHPKPWTGISVVSATFDRSRYTFQDWRNKGKLLEGVHWVRVGRTSILYNLPLLEDYIANLGDPAAHQRAIDNYLASLPSNAPAKSGRKRKTSTDAA
jgi:hypothetical protein